MSIYETSVRKPITTALIYVAIAVLGLFALSRLAIELMPKTDTTRVMVVTSYPGASAADIETNVSKPLENSLNGIDKLKHISTKSQDNASIVTLEFRAGTPIADAMNDIRDKLDAITDFLPSGVKKPAIFKFDTSNIPVAILSVESEGDYCIPYAACTSFVAAITITRIIVETTEFLHLSLYLSL